MNTVSEIAKEQDQRAASEGVWDRCMRDEIREALEELFYGKEHQKKFERALRQHSDVTPDSLLQTIFDEIRERFCSLLANNFQETPPSEDKEDSKLPCHPWDFLTWLTMTLFLPVRENLDFLFQQTVRRPKKRGQRKAEISFHSFIPRLQSSVESACNDSFIQERFSQCFHWNFRNLQKTLQNMTCQNGEACLLFCLGQIAEQFEIKSEAAMRQWFNKILAAMDLQTGILYEHAFLLKQDKRFGKYMTTDVFNFLASYFYPRRPPRLSDIRRYRGSGGSKKPEAA